jgi:hypothetical protein
MMMIRKSLFLIVFILKIMFFIYTSILAHKFT